MSRGTRLCIPAGAGPAMKNPWRKSEMNLTEQAAIRKADPTKAAALEAAAKAETAAV